MGDGASSSGGGVAEGGETVVGHCGLRRSSCGYCRSTSQSSISHGLWAYSITVDDYQELLDQGWRRSGCFLYKPEMDRTCCPSYTIRLKVEDFSPSKEQVRVQNKMQRFLDGALDGKKPEQVKLTQHSSKSLCIHDGASPTTVPNAPVSEPSCSSSEKISPADPYLHYLEKKIDDVLNTPALRAEFPIIQIPRAIVKRVTSQAKRKISNVSEDLLYTSNISFQVAAALRRSLLVEKDKDGQSGLSRSSVSQHGNLINFSPNIVAEKLAIFINEQGDIHGLSIKACSGHLNFYTTTKQPGAEFLSGEACAHSDGKRVNPKHCMSGGGISQHHKRRRLEIQMKQSSFDPEEFALYRRYQIKVHNDKPEEVSESTYRMFLVDTPLIFVPPGGGNKTVPHCGFGSFHQQYRIDGKLVAVGVVDILPRCLSSKYLFWDPEFSFLSLGKYSALQEINWVKEARVHCPGLQFYYLGYYIHTCNKMRYKAAYRPSELLCPLRYKWVPFDIARPLLDEKPYVILSDFTAQSDGGKSNRFTDGLTSQSELCSEDDDLNEASSEEGDSDGNEPGVEGNTVWTEAELVVETGRTLASDDLETVDLSNIMIDVNGLRVKYKELEHVIGPINRMQIKFLEKQLHRFVKVVGEKLANHMVYTLG